MESGIPFTEFAETTNAAAVLCHDVNNQGCVQEKLDESAVAQRGKDPAHHSKTQTLISNYEIKESYLFFPS